MKFNHKIKEPVIKPVKEPKKLPKKLPEEPWNVPAPKVDPTPKG